MGEDLTLGPLEVGLFGAETVMFAVDKIASSAEQLGAAADRIRIEGNIGLIARCPNLVHL